MANTFSTAQISQMQTDLNNALSLFNQNTPSSLNAAMASISAYYQIQVQSGYDSYAALANEVVTNSGVGGQTANTVLSYDGISYGSATSVHLMLFLAQGNLADITSTENNGAPASISEIETEHEQAYSKLEIPIQYWGATAFANSNINWLGAAATAAELSNTINTDFDNLSPSVVQQNFCNVLAAGTDVAFQVSAPYLQLTPGNPLAGIEAFAAFDNSDYNAIINNLPLLFETKASFSGCAINLFNGLHALFPAAPISPLIPDDPNQFLNFLSLLGSDAGSQSGAGGIDVATENSSVTLSATTSHNLTLQPDANSGETVTSSINNNFIEFTLGGSSSDLVYLLGEGSSFTATLTDQIVIASGGSDQLSAGANNVLLIDSDIGGTNILNAGTYSSVNEIVVSGSTIANSNMSGPLSSDNVFSFSGGTNVLVGDSGNNTFVENLTATAATNIIWGGGGTSTYELSGTIVVLYTDGTPTAQEIEGLSSQLSAAFGANPDVIYGTSNSSSIDSYDNGNLTYIIDPTKNDVLELPSYQATDYSGGQVSGYGGTPTYSSVAGEYANDDGFQNANNYASFYDFNNDSGNAIQIVQYVPRTSDNFAEYNEIENDYIPGGFGISPLETPSQEAFQEVVFAGNGPGNRGGFIEGDSAAVLSGGTALDVFVASNGVETVLSGGLSEGNTISNGGTIVVSSGGASSGTTILSGGEEIIYSGGVASTSDIQSGGLEMISGGVAYSTTLGGGDQYTLSGGKTYDAVVNSGSEQGLYWGGSATGSLVNQGGRESVYVSGLTSGSTITSGGSENVSAGAITSGVIVDNGGIEVVYGSGLFLGTTVGTGGEASNTTVNSGGFLVVLPGGSALNTSISGGKVVSTGVVDSEVFGVTAYAASVSSLTIDDLGREYVMSHGTASSTTVALGGIQWIVSGGVSSNTTLSSGGIQVTSSGGNARNTVVQNGGVDLVSGGVVFSTHVSSGGYDAVYSGGIASASMISAGGTEVTYFSGTASASTVFSGGVQNISSGGFGKSNVINNGGFEYVLGGGRASGTTVSSGGTEVVSSGGSDIGSTVTSGGRQYVYAVGSTVGNTIQSGGILTVSSGAMASNTVIQKGGKELVYSGGVVSAVSINSGGNLIALPGATVNIAINSGNDVTTGEVISRTAGISIYQSAFNSSTVGNGQQEFILSGGSSLNVLVTSANQFIYGGGTASANTVTALGNEYVSAGGVADSTVLSAGGNQYVSAGGVASSTVLSSGGSQIVSSRGNTYNALISAQGSQILLSGGGATSSTIYSGGVEIISAGGSVVDSVISSGGEEIVNSGGYEFGAMIANGGTEVLESGAKDQGVILFAASNATLSLEGSYIPTNTISGFDALSTNDEIVLSNFTYSAQADSVTLEAGNTLSLDLAGFNATLYFDPSQNFSGDIFNLTSNSEGQVVILDPPKNGNAVLRPSDDIIGIFSPWLNDGRQFSSSLQMAFLKDPPADNSSMAMKPSLFSDFWVRSGGSYSGRYSDTLLQLSGTSMRANAVSTYQSSATFGPITNQPLQSGTQVSSYVHSGFG